MPYPNALSAVYPRAARIVYHETPRINAPSPHPPMPACAALVCRVVTHCITQKIGKPAAIFRRFAKLILMNGADILESG